MGVRLARLWACEERWRPLGQEFDASYMKGIDRCLNDQEGAFCPDPLDIFKAFELTALDEVRVVIVGEEPYATPGLATGLCFAVRAPLANGLKRPYSLGRIYNRIEANLGHPPLRTGNLES